MSDAKLRDLRRRALAGDPDAEAKFLAELVRQGRLTPERAKVAALVGQPAAAEMLELAIETPEMLWDWIRALAEAEPEAGQRALLAACAVVRPTWEHANPDDGSFAALEEACARWLDGVRDNEDLHRATLLMPTASPVSYPPNRAGRVVRALGLALLHPAAGSHVLDGLRFAHLSGSPQLRRVIGSALRQWIDCQVKT